ncbi:M81 family metallopeptidase [Roseateles asaccharophilus]|uniref:Microcystinase C n=1 Tax=Roseateles asaccharophilus TaxID=582607 RepID=A0ABU2A8W9_9BURK|nr:M81 family metallopeptidase [Roseateles asaccharophilus]MDR7333609.1 microcystin degradation protein MlrC [Roseateles asaccharophilus]
MKLFLAGLVHETSSFSPLPTSVQSFRDGVLIHRGDAKALQQIAAQPNLVGVIAAAARQGDTLLPGLYAQAQPAGPLSRVDYEKLRDELLDDLRASLSLGAVDAVLLELHGAMLADGYPDCEGDLLTRVRALIGPRVPLGALLDLHCNLSPAMVESGAVLVACKEYPHIDYAARGEELHAMLSAMARGELAIRTQWRRVPLLGIFGTTQPPMRDFVRQLQTSEEAVPGIVSVSALHGFPWSDTPHTSAAVLVLAQDTPAAGKAATQLLGELAETFYGLRERAAANRLPLNAALDEAEAAMQRAGGRPVVLADTADNPGGGAAGDSTFVLRELLNRGIRDVALGMIWDPQAVAIAMSAGVGARLPLRIGGKVGPMSGDPVDLDVEVLACRADAHQRSLTPGGKDALGAAVAVRAQGVDIVLNSTRQQVFSPDCFKELGVEPTAKRLVVVKSTQHFRSGFDAMAASVVYADTPGSLASDLGRLPYKHLPRPVWPLD